MPWFKSCNLRLRRWKYRFLSDNYRCLTGKPDLRQPILIKGNGRITADSSAQIGFESSAGYWNTYAYLDVRNNGSISIAGGVIINNDASLTADGSSIYIGENTITGIRLTVSTSDGHCLTPENRHTGTVENKTVTIGSNVFIGDSVTILKGVTIGNNSVIGSNAVVTHDIPEGSVAAGNPCRVIRSLY